MRLINRVLCVFFGSLDDVVGFDFLDDVIALREALSAAWVTFHAWVNAHPLLFIAALCVAAVWASAVWALMLEASARR